MDIDCMFSSNFQALKLAVHHQFAGHQLFKKHCSPWLSAEARKPLKCCLLRVRTWISTLTHHPINVTNFYSPSSSPVILVVSKANPKDLLNSNSSLSTRDFQGQEVRDSNKADPCATFLEQEFRTKIAQKIGRVIFMISSDRSSGNSNYDTWYPWVAWKMWSMSSMMILCVALKVST